MKVLINTHSPSFNPENIVTGNTLRAYSLGEALREKNHSIKYLIQKNFIKGKRVNNKKEIIIYEDRFDFLNILKKESPDAVIFIQGENLEFLKGFDGNFLVIGDFIAPSLIEYTFQELTFEEWFFKFITRLSLSDYILCSTDRQKAYYLNLIMCSGFDIKEDRIKTLPLSAKDLKVENIDTKKPVEIVMGGVPWPWINSSKYLKKFIEILEKKGEEFKLTIFRGKYPFKIASSKYHDDFKEIETYKNVEISDFLPYSKLLKKYQKSDVAFDLFEKNLERELSFSFRNIDYLNCALPVISVDFTTMSNFIEKYDAGWIVKNMGDLDQVVDEILQFKNLKNKRKNAKKLFREKFDIEKNINTLTEIIEKGKKRKNKNTFIQIISPFIDEVIKEKANLEEEIKRTKNENHLLRKEKEKLLEHTNEKEKDLISTISVVEEQKKYIEKIEKNLDETLKLINEKDVSLKEQEHIISDLKKYSGELETKIKGKDEKIKILYEEISNLKKEISNLKEEIFSLKKLLSKKVVKIALRIDKIIKGKKN